MISVRLCLFLLIFAIWFWANSIFTPWATSIDPRLWLYDVLFYTRFILLFWAVFELLYAWQQLRNRPGQRKFAIASITMIGIAAVTVSAYLYLMHTGNGFRARVQMSSEALTSLRIPDFADVRKRAGWFLIDTQRQPCNDQPWLWLGNTYGGGTGNNLALVYSAGAIPKTPSVDAFRFWPLSDGWWLAYQNPKKYQFRTNDSAVCKAGEAVATHDEGMLFVSSPLHEDTIESQK